MGAFPYMDAIGFACFIIVICDLEIKRIEIMETEKKYLSTIEEVSDALAAGKVVYDENGSSFWLDKNGFIVSESESFGPVVGAMVDLNVENYILESKPLEVKLWHLYEEEKGRRVLILSKDKTNLFPFTGVLFTENGYYDFDYFSNNGKSSHIDKRNLVKELADLSKYFEKGERK